jgi:putative FmdB family regulatory protein
MILYEYKCSCGFEFETRRPIELRTSAECPKCGVMANKRLSVVSNTFGFQRTWGHLEPGPDRLVRNV